MSFGARTINVTFRLNYYTKFGENLAVVGNLPQLGDWSPLTAKKMEHRGDGNWILETKLIVDEAKTLEYRYIIVKADNTFDYEAGSKRVLNLEQMKNVPSIFLDDIWKTPESTEELLPHVRSSIFSDVIFGRNKEVTSGQLRSSYSREGTNLSSKILSNYNVKEQQDNVVINFRLYCVYVDPKSSIRISGGVPALGSWDLAKAPKMSDKNYPLWELEIVVPKNSIPFDYKFVQCEENGDNAIWEDGPNRSFASNWGKSAVFIDSGKFKRNYEFKGAGVAVPVFSLRSKQSCGVGEFNDLKFLVDWAVKSGLKIVQILPVNDTRSRNDWRDSYPYSAISVFALHPILLHLPSVTKDANILKEINEKSATFNKSPVLDYEAVLNFKMDVMKRLFKTERTKFVEEAQYKKWFNENDSWLIPYAMFSTLRDKFNTADWSQWPELSRPKPEEVKAASESKEYSETANLWYFIQYHLHLQLKEASDYAAKNRIGFKGDIAIGVNPKSVETWTQPDLFRLNKSTGAPPDPFSADGQNWGFPTYNWNEMAKDDYAWWRSRLTHMAQYFSATRIDHILGFFRIWEIPAHAVTGLLGRFQPSIPLWRGELESRNFWDFDRLTKPYIRSHLVQQQFGNDYDTIRKYFEPTNPGVFKLRPEYSTEKQIAAALPTVESSTVTADQAAANQKIKNSLFSFVQNVILLQDDEDPNKFYPRIECMKTSSYNELDPYLKDQIRDLYIDYYYRRQEGLWSNVALQRLPVMVNSTKMLICGEDLGMVPACVPPVMNSLNIVGLRIQRMANDPKIEFWHPSDYPYLSVCTPSVHDTSTLRGWWEEDRGVTQRFWNQILGEYGVAPLYCDDHVTQKIFNQHIYSKSMWSIFAIQDFFGLEYKYYEGVDPKKERINEPSNPEHYWRYRIHVNLEDLVQDTQFTDKLKNMFKYSGRL